MQATKLTRKGAATRERIVAATADLVLARGVDGTSLDDIGAETATSKGQLFHYFPGGKAELVAAIASFQGERVLDAQRPYLDSLDSWDAWDGWRRAVLAHYRSQPHWGCPISALAREGQGGEIRGPIRVPPGRISAPGGPRPELPPGYRSRVRPTWRGTGAGCKARANNGRTLGTSPGHPDEPRQPGR